MSDTNLFQDGYSEETIDKNSGFEYFEKKGEYEDAVSEEHPTPSSRNRVKTPAKKQKMENLKKPKENRNTLIASIAFIASFVLFLAMVSIQRNLVTHQNTTDVFVAKADIAKGVTISAENLNTYFTLEKRLSDTIPKTAVVNSSELIGKTTLHKIWKKEIISVDAFSPYDYYDGIEDPVIISLKVAAPVNAVSGTLRAGDVVDIKWMSTSIPASGPDYSETQEESNSTIMDNITMEELEDVQEMTEDENQPEDTTDYSEDYFNPENLEGEEDLTQVSPTRNETASANGMFFASRITSAPVACSMNTVNGLSNIVQIASEIQSETENVQGSQTKEEMFPVAEDSINPETPKKVIPTFTNLETTTFTEEDLINGILYVDLAKNVRVKEVFTAEAANVSTTENSDSNTTPIVTMINIVIPRAMENTFFYASEDGILKFTKVVSASEGE